MKNWFARWFGGATRRGDKPSATPAPAADTAPAMPAAAAPGAGPADRGGVDLAFYRWLAGSAGGDAPQATERLITDELARLAREPEKAAGLVPRVPAVIPELLRSLRMENVSSADLSRMVAQDLVLVAEVIREANSPYYRSTTPVRNIEGAVMLLGQNGLRMLLARVAFRPVISMQTGRFAKLVAPLVWSQSEKCAQAAGALAPQAGANPFEAYLAGLVQNVGLVVAFRLIDQVYTEDVLPRSDAFSAALLGHARRLAEGIARQWEFPEAVAEAVAGKPGPLGEVLAAADALSKLRLLLDAGVLAPDDPLVAAHLTPARLPVFNQLRPQEG
ncbi:HDOD domain-containing protein [Massilia sp. SYSU DXS3249]